MKATEKRENGVRERERWREKEGSNKKGRRDGERERRKRGVRREGIENQTK